MTQTPPTMQHVRRPAGTPSMLDARILVVDDQEANVLLLRFMLEQEGFTNVHTLTDSCQVCSWCAVQQPDLILLDLLMPHLDGFGVIKQLEERTTPGEVAPILVLTADATLETKRRALAVGARDFVTKPFDRDEVLLRVKNLLRTRLAYRQRQDQNRLLAARLRARASELDV